MKAKTIKGVSVKDIFAELEKITDNTQVPEEQKFIPTLAIVFVSMIEEWQEVLDRLDQKGISVFGAITPISFDDQSILEKGIVVMLLDLDTSYFKIFLADNMDSSLRDSISHITKIGMSSFSDPAFLISVSDLRNSGDEIVKIFQDQVGKEVKVMGGFSGDILTWKGHVFTNKQSSDDGVLALIFDQDKVHVNGIAVSGWKAVGTEKVVTKSEGNWIFTIDEQPAIEVLKKFVGDHSIEDDSSESIIKLDTTTYVLQADRGGDSPAYIATLEYNTENGGILCSTQISEGTKFRFSLPPDFEVVDKVIETSQTVKEKDLPDADAMIIFSCIGRSITLGPMALEEIKGLAQTWEKPTAGFFSLGEFGRVENGRPEYHGTTCSWVALKEN